MFTLAWKTPVWSVSTFDVGQCLKYWQELTLGREPAQCGKRTTDAGATNPAFGIVQFHPGMKLNVRMKMTSVLSARVRPVSVLI